MNTIEQLRAQKHQVWSDDLVNPLSKADLALWWTLSELARLAIEHLSVDEFQIKYPDTYTVLWGGREYFKQQQRPRPYQVERLFVLLDLWNSGLPFNGE